MQAHSKKKGRSNMLLYTKPPSLNHKTAAMQSETPEVKPSSYLKIPRSRMLQCSALVNAGMAPNQHAKPFHSGVSGFGKHVSGEREADIPATKRLPKPWLNLGRAVNPIARVTRLTTQLYADLIMSRSDSCTDSTCFISSSSCTKVPAKRC